MSIKCGICSADLTPASICVWHIDGAEDGRFEAPTYNLSIKCHICRHELFRLEGANSDYSEREPC